MGSNKRYLIVIILAVIAITIAAIGSVKGAVATEPVRPWYLEPPEVFQPTHIREGDRLYASYFNEQFNVIYNWAQLLNREWKNFTNGTGIASITANLITAKDKIVTPVISIVKGNQPAPDGNGGLIYYDKDLDRFRAYQEGAWRDLSSNVYIASDTIGSPLTIQGYLQASNIYASNTVYAHGVNNTGTLTNTGNVVTEGLNANKRLKVPTFSSTQTADSSLGKGSLYYDSTSNKLKAYNGSTWEDVAEDSGEWTTSSTTGDKIFNNGKISFASDSNLIIPRANLSYSPPVGATDTLKLHNSDLYTYDSMWKRLTGVWNAPYTSGQKRWESHGEKFYFEGNIEVGAGSRSSGNVHIVFQPDTKNYTYSDSSYLRASLTYEPTLLVGNCTEINTDYVKGVGSLSGNITAPSFSHIRRIKESSSSDGSSEDISGPVIHIQSPSRYIIESNTIVDASGTVYAPYGLILPGEASATSKINSLRVNNNGDLQLYYGGWKNVGTPAQTVDTAMCATSTNAVQNMVIKAYVDRKTAGISSETANINHANIIDLNGGDIDANNVTVTTKLSIPTSKTSSPITGSICFNAASNTLNVYDNGSWISFGSGGGEVNQCRSFVFRTNTEDPIYTFTDASGTVITHDVINASETIMLLTFVRSPLDQDKYILEKAEILFPVQPSIKLYNSFKGDTIKAKINFRFYLDSFPVAMSDTVLPAITSVYLMKGTIIHSHPWGKQSYYKYFKENPYTSIYTLELNISLDCDEIEGLPTEVEQFAKIELWRSH